MRNEVLFDKKGRPDIMVAFTPDELGLPPELRGKTVKEYLISKYPNTMIDGVPYSLPFQKPATNVNHDEAIELCQSKGPGWHLLTNDEWAALARQSWENDTIPTGNTRNGHSHSHPEQTGTTYDGSGKTLAGSGPIQWNHDRTAEGVADLVGNVWEHVGGIRFLNGQVQVIPDNGAAAGADQSENSKEWQAIYTADGDPIYFNPVDGEIFVQPCEAIEKDYDGVRFTELHASEIDVPDKLIELGLYPPQEYEGDDYFWVDNDGGRCVYRGGNWHNGGNAGLFYLGGSLPRSNSYTHLGFRSAYVRYSGESGTLDNLDPETTEQQPEPKRRSIMAPNFLDMIRKAIAHQFQKLYEAAGGEDPQGFALMANEATNEELQKAAALSHTLAQVNAAVDSYEAISGQIKLATMTSITIKTEVPDHE